jgi:hypothetical protein
MIGVGSVFRETGVSSCDLLIHPGGVWGDLSGGAEPGTTDAGFMLGMYKNQFAWGVASEGAGRMEWLQVNTLATAAERLRRHTASLLPDPTPDHTTGSRHPSTSRGRHSANGCTWLGRTTEQTCSYT